MSKRKAPSPDSIRSCVFDFVLWLDNPAMQAVYDYITQTPLQVRGYEYCAIHHEPDKDDSKPHEHFMIRFPDKRKKTVGGVRKMYGIDRTVWRLATMELNTSVSEKFVKCDVDTDHPNGYRVESRYKDSECWVLSDPNDPASFIEQPYKDGELRCNAPCTKEQLWRYCAIYRVPHVEATSDMCSYALYMLHRTAACAIDGLKTVYDVNDMYGDEDFIRACFPYMKTSNKVSAIHEIMLLKRSCIDFPDFLYKCIELERDDLIEYAEKHTYLVNSLFTMASGHAKKDV